MCNPYRKQQNVVKFIFSSILILFPLQKKNPAFYWIPKQICFVLEKFPLNILKINLEQILLHLTHQFLMKIFPKSVYNF